MMELTPTLAARVEQLKTTPISADRKAVLQALIDYVQQKHSDGKPIKLNFICTHNSRRSQLSQVWAKTAADYYGIQAETFSGGVEVTAFNDRAVAALTRAGFDVTKQENGSNPRFLLFASKNGQPIVTFSKVYDDPANPDADFAAIMTCSHADENCPFIPGTEARIPVRYDDPKDFDGTPLEATKYDERSDQIASEMFYVFSKINSAITS